MPSSRVTAILFSSHATVSPFPSICRRISTQPLRPQPHQQRARARHLSKPTILFFSTSNISRAKEQNFYEILDIPTTATAAEIKKQFYALSMRHHPDRNREDLTASQRFSRISAAYNVLGNASKRATYDHEHGFHHPTHASPGHSPTHKHPMGSHSSYAGSRPASGLSKRRTAFHGPPPSFYEQGGYGGTGRRAQGFAGGAGAAAGGGGKDGKEADPEDWEGFIRRNPLNHFNARGHFRTQTAEDQRRRERRVREGRRRLDEERDGAEPGKHQSFGRFFVCSGILLVTVVVVDMWRSVPNRLDERKAVRR